MPHSLSGVNVHLVYGVKYRSPLLNPTICKRLYAFMAATLERCRCFPVEINGTEDHLHCLFVLGRQYSIAKIVEELKKSSSKWLKTNGSEHSNFYWQIGYGIFSVSYSQIELVKTYIRTQDLHHRHISFEEERRALLINHGFSLNDWNLDDFTPSPRRCRGLF